MNTGSIRLVLAAIAWCAVGNLDAAAQSDRYGNPPFNFSSPSAPPIAQPASNAFNAPPVSTPSSFAPPPGVLDGARGVVTDSGNALRRGIESGIQQANEQFANGGSQIVQGARNVGDGFNAQFQDFADSTASQFQFSGDNFRNAAEQTLRTAANGASGVAAVVSGVSPPPWPTDSATTNAPLWSSASAPPSNSFNSAAITPVGTGGAAGFNDFPGTPRSVNVITTPTGWTSLDREVPPPPLMTPSLAPSDARGAASTSPPGAATGSSSPFTSSPFGASPVSSVPNNSTPTGPQFPEPPALGGGTIHSPLFDPTASGVAGGRYDFGTPAGGGTLNGSAALPPPSNPAGVSDPFSRPPESGAPSSTVNPAGQPPPGTVAGAGGNNVNTSFPFGAPGQSPQTPATSVVGQGQSPSPSLPAIGTNTNSSANRNPTATVNTTSNTNTAPQGEPVAPTPWMPLVLTGLGLVGSLSANFFLGWSYMDARQKYRALARKTADKFRRAAEAA